MLSVTSIRVFSLIFFILYLLVAFVWPTFRIYKQTGINPITFGKTDSAHDYIGRWFKLVIGLSTISVLFYWRSSLYGYLMPFSSLEQHPVQVTGVVLCIVSLIWISVAQWQMGNSWRIGLDQVNKTPLVQKGLFSVSRNPVFLGMLVSLTGFFLLLPNMLSLLVLVVAYLLIQIQIRLEEEFLFLQHGKSYSDYRSTVRRLI
ncbi:MAG TPA: methyltransferase [Sphingobacteriaceae bacterium]